MGRLQQTSGAHEIFVNQRTLPISDANKMLNRRAEVEQVLFDMAFGKRQPPTPAQCRLLAMHLGDPTRADWLSEWNKP